MRRLTVCASLIVSNLVWAAPAGTAATKQVYNSEGVKVELSLGVPSVKITNTDGTKAGYTGLSANARAFAPLFSTQLFRMDFLGSIKYLDLKNSANGAQREFAQYIGPGVGLELSVSRFFIGSEYYYLKGRHTAIGNFSNYAEFDISGANLYYGFRFALGQASVGVASSQMTSTVGGVALSLSKDCPWADQIYWVQLTYDFKVGTWEFLKNLVGGPGK